METVTLGLMPIINKDREWKLIREVLFDSFILHTLSTAYLYFHKNHWCYEVLGRIHRHFILNLFSTYSANSKVFS